MTLVIIAFASIIILYFLFSFLPIRICAICLAVSLTWLALLAAYFLGWHDNILLPGIMMGGSVVGFMYKGDKFFKDKLLTNFWIWRIGIIVFGFLFIYLALLEKWSELGFAVILAILGGFISLFFTKTYKEEGKDAAPEKLKEKLKHKLEHCCDL